MSPACLIYNEMGFDKYGTNVWARLIWSPCDPEVLGSSLFSDLYSDGEGEGLLRHQGLRRHILPPVNRKTRWSQESWSGGTIVYPFRRSIEQALLVLHQARERFTPWYTMKPVLQEACDLSAQCTVTWTPPVLVLSDASLKRVLCDELANDKFK